MSKIIEEIRPHFLVKTKRPFENLPAGIIGYVIKVNAVDNTCRIYLRNPKMDFGSMYLVPGSDLESKFIIMDIATRNNGTPMHGKIPDENIPRYIVERIFEKLYPNNNKALKRLYSEGYTLNLKLHPYLYDNQ